MINVISYLRQGASLCPHLSPQTIAESTWSVTRSTSFSSDHSWNGVQCDTYAFVVDSAQVHWIVYMTLVESQNPLSLSFSGARPGAAGPGWGDCKSPLHPGLWLLWTPLLWRNILDLAFSLGANRSTSALPKRYHIWVAIWECRHHFIYKGPPSGHICSSVEETVNVQGTQREEIVHSLL